MLHNKSKNPKRLDKKTRTDLSFLKKLTNPVTKEVIPEINARVKGIESLRLLKYVSPPLSPDIINKAKILNKIKKPIINATDHLPKFVFGKKVIFIKKESKHVLKRYLQS